MKRVLLHLIKWIVAIGLLAFVIWINKDKLREIGSRWDQFQPDQLLICGGLYLSGLLLTFFRWYLLVRAQELPFRQIDAVRLGFVSLFFSSFLPGSVGGDLVKAGFLAREQKRRTVAISTVIVDRVVGLFGLMLLASLVGFVFWDEANAIVDQHGQPRLRWIVVSVWTMAGIGTVAVLLFLLVPWKAETWLRRMGRVPKLGHVLAELVHAAAMYRHKGRFLAVATGLAIIGHIGFVLSFYFAARAVPEPIPTLEQHCLIVPVGMVVEAVPISLGGIGVGEAAFEYLYHLVDTPDGAFEGKGFLARLGQRMVVWVVALIGLGFYIPLRGTVRQMMAEAEQNNTESPKSASA